jgi:hypothetical protein
MGLFDAVAGAAGGILGGIAGAQGDNTSKHSTKGMDLAPETALEKSATSNITDLYSQLQGLTQAGAGQSDVSAATTSQRDLASMLQSFAAGGFMPGEADINSANGLASQLFKPQQVQLDQTYQQQQEEAARLAAKLGRPINDPIIQAKLGQERMRQQSSLAAQQGSYAAQYAQNLPMQRLGFASQLSDVRNNLASQAMANRQALLGLGQSLRNDDRNFRMGTAQTWSNEDTHSGGGFAGMLSGALGGLGAGMKAAPGLSAAFGGMFSSGPKVASPTATAGGTMDRGAPVKNWATA